MPDPRIVFVQALCIAAALAGVLALAASYANGTPSARTAPVHCFPAKAWDANDRDRPCVYRLYEDGSVDVRQRDGDNLPAS